MSIENYSRKVGKDFSNNIIVSIICQVLPTNQRKARQSKFANLDSNLACCTCLLRNDVVLCMVVYVQGADDVGSSSAQPAALPL